MTRVRKPERNYHRFAYHGQAEYQLLAPRRLLCLLCARVVGTHAKAAHERGIEHRLAVAERKAS